MRIPVYDSPEVTPGAAPEARLNTHSTPDDFGAQMGPAIDRLGGAFAEQVKKASEQARAVKMTNAERDVQQGNNAWMYGGALPPDQQAGGNARGPSVGTTGGGGLPAPAGNINAPQVVGGALNARGEAAVAAAEDAHKNMADMRERVANKYFQSPEDRQLFLMRTSGAAEAAHRQLEEHVGRQIEVAKEASSQGLQETSLQAIANSYADPQARALYAAKPEGPIRALALSPEDADAKLSAWRQKVAATVMNQYLDNQDEKGAQDYFAQARADLGPASAQFEQRLLTMKNQLEGGKKANAILQGSLTPNGQPDRSKIFVQLENMPEGKLKDDTRKELMPRLSLAEAAWGEEEKQRLGRVIQGVEKTNGWLDESSQDFVSLSDDAKARAIERAKTIQRQVRGSNADERRQQAEQNKVSITGASAMDDSDLVKLDPAQTFPTADQATINAIKGLQKKAAARIQKGDAPKMAEFKSSIAATAEQLGFTGNPAQKQLGADLMATMVQWREQYIEKNADKAPTRQEIDKKLAEELTHTKSHWYSGGGFKFQADKAGETFEPGPAEDQKYEPAKAAMTIPAVAPAKTQAITRTRNGVTKTWNGSKWVLGG